MATKLVLVLVLSLLATGALADVEHSERYSERRWQQQQAQQCQLQRITTRQPSHRIESEGGMTEIWDPEEDEFQCAGVAAMRVIIQPNSLSLPKFFPAPRLLYIVQGRGVLGISYPGCPETFHSQQLSRGLGEGGRRGDQHQKVHRIRQGDVIAIPHGAAHWTYNDGSQELVAVSVLHLNNENNQLDQTLRAFMLAGGQPRRGQGQQRYQRSRRYQEESERHQDNFQNIFRAFDTQLLAEAFNLPENIVRKMQQDDFRGLIVKCDRELRIMTPDEEQQLGGRCDDVPKQQENGLEESFCTMQIRHNIDINREADFYTRQGGKVNICNQQKLPLLRFLDMSAERGELLPNGLYTPHWSMTDHRVVYAIRGELHVQVVDDNGNTIMDERVRPGDIFVIPQFYVAVSRAGNEGFEWITFKTNSQPLKNPIAGSTSVMRAMPIDVVANSYQMSPRDSQQVKMNRDPQSLLFSPTSRSMRLE